MTKEQRMYEPMSLTDFYHQALASNGITIESEPVEKIAEARGVDPVVAKIAKAVFDQSRIDNVEFDSQKTRCEDSFKIAEAYVRYMDDVKIASTKLAADLARVASFAIEGFLAQHGISDVTASDGIKIAAVCVEELEQKVAEPGSDFVMRMMAARKAKKGKGHEASESPKTEAAEESAAK